MAVELEFNKPDELMVIPTMFHFPHRKGDDGMAAFERGALVIEDNCRSFSYPLKTKPDKNPVQYIQEIILRGSSSVRSMMKDAYLAKKIIRIMPDIEVYWSEYESLLKQCSFYLKKPDTAIIDEEWNISE